MKDWLWIIGTVRYRHRPLHAERELACLGLSTERDDETIVTTMMIRRHAWLPAQLHFTEASLLHDADERGGH